MQVTYNRLAAAQDQYRRADDAFFNLGGKVSLELVLDARIRLAEAETAYHRARVEYAIAVKNVHFSKGSLLEYNGATLASNAYCQGAPCAIAHKGAPAGDAAFNYAMTTPPAQPPDAQPPDGEQASATLPAAASAESSPGVMAVAADMPKDSTPPQSSVSQSKASQESPPQPSADQPAPASSPSEPNELRLIPDSPPRSSVRLPPLEPADGSPPLDLEAMGLDAETADAAETPPAQN
jgi:hypothetical protein